MKSRGHSTYSNRALEKESEGWKLQTWRSRYGSLYGSSVIGSIIAVCSKSQSQALHDASPSPHPSLLTPLCFSSYRGNSALLLNIVALRGCGLVSIAVVVGLDDFSSLFQP